MYILNKFIINTVDFLNKFASTTEEVGTVLGVLHVFIHKFVYKQCIILNSLLSVGVYHNSRNDYVSGRSFDTLFLLAPYEQGI